MENFGFALGIVGLLTGALVAWMALRVRGAFRDLEARVGELERETQRKRHTHRTIAGLEDATALIIDLKIEAEVMQARLDTVRRILGKTREGPESYTNKEFEPRRREGEQDEE